MNNDNEKNANEIFTEEPEILLQQKNQAPKATLLLKTIPPPAGKNVNCYPGKTRKGFN